MCNPQLQKSLVNAFCYNKIENLSVQMQLSRQRQDEFLLD